MRKKTNIKKRLINEEKEKIVSGIIRVHPRGFGFLKMEENPALEVFVPKNGIQGAIDGDFVDVVITGVGIADKGPEGRVLQVIRRGRSHLAGSVTSVQEGKAMAYAPMLGHNQKIEIKSEKPLQVGDRVIIQVTCWGSNQKTAEGIVSDHMGHISDPSCDVRAAAEEFELEESFPHKVIQEARALGKVVSSKEIAKREDLRALEIFTIDPDSAKDFDDALSLTIDKKGHYQLGVHIADVSHYVQRDTLLDKEAKERCNSTYFPGTVIPMLPHELSSNLCSLKPNVNRLTISVFASFDAEGNLLQHRMSRTVINSKKRFTYKEAKAILDGKKKSKHAPTLFLMVDLCHRLKRKRYERGSIEFTLPDIEIKMDKQGMPEKVELVEYDITHQLVEEFMLKANEIVATHLSKEGKPLTYRVHGEPDSENMREFAQKALSFGFKISSKPTSEELQKLFDAARKTPYAQLLATAFIRSMRLATYSIDNVGHYGLGLEYYTHFTSPIRRYIDLMVHRVLCNEVNEEDDLEAIAQICSEKERLSARAEGTVRLLKKMRLLQSMVERDPNHFFPSVITAIKPFGIIFEVTSLLLEGFLSLSQLESDYFIYDQNSSSLRGRHTGITYATGTTIEVHVESIDLITQEVKWRLKKAKGESSAKKKHYGRNRSR